MSWTLEGRRLRAVLVARLRYLGDVAMATVVLGALRRGDPGLRLGFLCEAAYADLLVDHPDLERVHGLTVRRSSPDAAARRGTGAWSRAPEEERTARAHCRLAGAWRTVRDLRDAGYDAAVDLFFNPRSALLLRAAGTRWRIGGSTSARRRLYTHTAPAPGAGARPVFRRLAPGGLGDHLSRLAPLRHEPSGLAFLEWFETACAQEPPSPRLATPPLGDGPARAALAAAGIAPGQPFLLLAPGATWPFKEWPVERWRGLIGLLAEAQPWPLLLLAPPLRAELYAPLAAALPHGRGGALPALSLREALRVVAACALLVTVDGGIMHAAVAMARPTLALFGPTEPAVWFPYTGRGPFRVLCRPTACHPCDVHVCGHFTCLPGIGAREAADAALALLPRPEAAR